MTTALMVLFGLVTATSFGSLGYAALAGRPAITEMKNLLQVDQAVWSGAAFAAVTAGIGVVLGFWFMIVGLLAAVALLVIAAGMAGLQQRAGLAPQRYVPAALLVIVALLYLFFLVSR